MASIYKICPLLAKWIYKVVQFQCVASNSPVWVEEHENKETPLPYQGGCFSVNFGNKFPAASPKPIFIQNLPYIFPFTNHLSSCSTIVSCQCFLFWKSYSLNTCLWYSMCITFATSRYSLRSSHYTCQKAWMWLACETGQNDSVAGCVLLPVQSQILMNDLLA